MTVFRRHLRLWVTIWIAFQIASLSAFVPRDCCAGHRAAAAQEQQPDASCHQAHALPPQAECAIGGTCNGPLGMLAALLSPHAVIPPAVPAFVPAGGRAPALPSLESPRPLSVPPDSPPPRG